ncbi:MAG: leucine-rich repeat domain-containing protein [Clostridia bacterium]|nr:leucine-rich repeat domain-containing protein [Clostridia bacterium]
MLYEDEYVTFDEGAHVLRIKDCAEKDVRFMISGFLCKYKELEKPYTVIIPDSVMYVAPDFLLIDTICAQKIPINNINWPMEARVLEEDTFRKCNKLEWINLPEGLKKIGRQAFSGCGSLTDVVIPTTVYEVGECIFYDCFELKKIYVPRILMSKYTEDYFKSNTSAEVICYDSNEDLHKEYKSRFKKMKERLETTRIQCFRTQRELNRRSNNIRRKNMVGDGLRDIREKARENMINIDVTVRLNNFLKSIPRIPEGMSQNSNSNHIDSNPITEKKTAYKITVLPSKEVKSFNGVIRKNLIAEKKKK